MSMEKPVFTPSHREEIIAWLTTIAAFLADQNGYPSWIFWAIMTKAIGDHLLAFKFAWRSWFGKREE